VAHSWRKDTRILYIARLDAINLMQVLLVVVRPYPLLKAFDPELVGKEHPDYLSAMANLGMIYDLWEKYDQAEKCFTEVMETRRQKLGEDHLLYTGIVNILALMYRKKGDR